MLSEAERAALVNRENLSPQERAKITYRVAKKLENRLLELRKIDEILRLLPEKNARRALNDDVAEAVLSLAEDIIKILGYGPLKIDNDGHVYTTRSEPPRSKGRSKTFAVTAELADHRDVARKMLIDDHIAVLSQLVNQSFGAHLSDVPDTIIYDSISGNIDPVRANEILARWGRPRVQTFKERIAFPTLPKNRL